MDLAPNLFDDLAPPTIHVIMHRLENPQDEDRLVTLILRPAQGREIVSSFRTDRYAPESSTMLALSHAFQTLEVVQREITRKVVDEAIKTARLQYESPF